jgi:hypothetical protein
MDETQKKSDRAEIARSIWWIRALLATEQDKLGCVLRFVMNKQQGDAKHPQVLDAYLSRATILDDTASENIGYPKDGSGVVWCNVGRPGALKGTTEPVFTVREWAGNIQRLVDTLDLNEEEAFALVDSCKQFIRHDYRKGLDVMGLDDRIPDC